MECAGNGRSFLSTKQAGVPWGAGAVGHAEWTGVPLHVILHKAGLKPGIREIVFEGHDTGTEADHPQPMNFDITAATKITAARIIVRGLENGQVVDRVEEVAGVA